MGEVYPRVCEGTFRAGRVLRLGLSPRVRGNQVWLVERPVATGSIPACAGEPWTMARIARQRRVYPRVCGGTCLNRCWRWLRGGLSPRVRGNHLLLMLAYLWKGSIPACAGEPKRHLSTPLPTPVYPRVCGGTASADRKSSHDFHRTGRPTPCPETAPSTARYRPMAGG